MDQVKFQAIFAIAEAVKEAAENHAADECKQLARAIQCIIMDVNLTEEVE